jgi:peptide/nickel transport system permease protein
MEIPPPAMPAPDTRKKKNRESDPLRIDLTVEAASFSPAKLVWRRLKKNKPAVAGAVTLLLLYTVALFGQFIAPYDLKDQSPGGHGAVYHPPMKLRWREANGAWHWRPFVYGTVSMRPKPGYPQAYLANPNRLYEIKFFVRGPRYKFLGLIPCSLHLFGAGNGYVYLLGTDEQRTDYFSRLIYGSQISLTVGLVAIFISFSLGLLAGGISGYFGGCTDNIIMRFCEILMCVPSFYLLLALSAALPQENSVLAYLLIICILSLLGWAGLARAVRGMALAVRQREYVEAARALGMNDLAIILRHILPSTFTYAIIAATMLVPEYILQEAGLSFLGVGIQKPMASWGNMLSAAQNIDTLSTHSWILAPAILIFVTTLAYNFLGDGLRDALDPKTRS